MTMEDSCTTTLAVNEQVPLPMSPTTALTSRFEIDAGPGPGGADKEKAGGASLLVGGESRQGFRIGELRLMMGYDDASELSEMVAVHRLPNAPDWFRGIANLHGKLTPVFDLALYFGIDRDTEARSMLLVLAHGVDAAGVVIDGLPERLRWSEEGRADVGAALERLVPHLRGACVIDGRLWFDLDPRSLLDALEQSIEVFK